ncbi:hypothetical protein CLV24_104170 [Pontibacter ummariensis]|uniref:Uncharacterized protein n=1 Tax=Pontibacter ummariensis TaxID=1610492 RepID=A0A239DDW4_9BACT|nr:hypothetical protein [Pontibacter ummariensis]PRY14360.1 hypothetical protein CLV24_104170 [Pontibacter ummariensis]SNS30108.1 hypothetical protein SAMN06296052_104169 [Pontibacter ummariensis]
MRRNQGDTNKREVLKQILSGALSADQVKEKLEEVKGFDIYKAVVEFMGGTDNEVVKNLFPTGT